MLSIQQAYEVKASIIEYLKATFSFKDQEVYDAFYRFIEDPVNGMFKGPYVSLKLPFKKGSENKAPFDFSIPFHPHAHQENAFIRLSTNDNHNPRPTLLTTGTGSGKTEAFLFPILDYCLKNSGNSGIKAIILYPMNALATDQAKRLAETINKNEKLNGKITAGLLIGEGKSKKKFSSFMTEDKIIEQRDIIVNSPPDILLTNFKMLDYALMRAQYHNLWKFNFENGELLKFLVLDELHTYDGAQGSDVANLIRRLKLKLNIPKGYICPVGTSATLGSGMNSRQLLVEYASKVFGEDFSIDSVIEEERIPEDEFLGAPPSLSNLPTQNLLESKKLENNDSYGDYMKKQMELWGIDSSIDDLRLGEELRKLKIVHDLIRVCSKGIRSISEIIIELERINIDFAKLKHIDDKIDLQITTIRSLLSLLSKTRIRSGSRLTPFLYIQVHLWIRELSGVVRKFQDETEFTWSDKREDKYQPVVLPPYYCRECGASGWMGVKHENKSRVEKDVADMYQKYFSSSANVYFINKHKDGNLKVDDYEPSDMFDKFIDVESLNLYDKSASERLRVIGYRKLRNNKLENVCPSCNSKNSVSIIGTRIGTLSSIVTSQILSSDLDINIDRNRKVLAFTNSVQDAAHQAGFIQSRNFRFTFRTAIQKVVNDSEKAINLVELQDRFVKYWSKNADETGNQPLEAYFYKFFPPDHCGDVKIGAYKNSKESFNPRFIEEFNHRIKWEIASEFGYNALIGRTLERTGSSSVYFPITILDKVYPAFSDWLTKNALERIDKADFNKLLFGFLYRLRVRGGVDHIFLDKFRTQKSSYYLITQGVNKQHFLMQNFGKKTRLPKFITDHSNKYDVFDLITQESTSTNWYNEYFTKTFAEKLVPNYKELVNDFYSNLLNVLVSDEIAILDQKDAAGIRNFALKPEVLFISKNLIHFKCNTCGHSPHIPEQNADIVEGMPCINFRCSGRYLKDSSQELDNYYQQVYNRGRSPRIYAHDHTGLLDRTDRERIEKQFKERPDHNSYNTLVATSTLEMGIDVGTLNTIINNSVPPLPANFIQRIGRAGRDSGNSLVIDFGLNKPHDQYYFQEPKEMMQGEIHTPACYLEAKEILRRHFFAFSIDQWVKEDHISNIIPSLFYHLKLENLNLEDKHLFINKIISYLKKNEERLLDQFISAYDFKIIKESIDELKISLRSDFYPNIRKSILNVKNEFDHIQERINDINKYIKKKNLTQNDPEVIELRGELKNLRGLIKNIKKRQIIEHLTNVGILPNYAFPETGVVLNAQIRLNNSTETTKDFRLKSLEIVRPSKSAIHELNPDNFFYTQGYRLRISGVNTFGYKDKVMTYRYCSNCDHIDIDTIDVQNQSCPKCSDPSWNSSSNIHHVLKMENFMSFEYEKNAVITDAREEREQVNSIISRHLKFHPKSLQGAWATKNIPFGIEYVKEVDITEINTGVIRNFFDRSRVTTINGKEVPSSGYIVCRYCGKSTSTTFNEDVGKPKEAGEFHYGYCKHKEVIYQSKPDEVFDEIYFFRTLKTEAIKILLPVQEFESESSISMFRAGILLGLKHYYGGNPQHLEIIPYSEVNERTHKKDRYLVMYDVIPGGTGYLSKLFDKTEFSKVLLNTYESIKNCSCQHEGKDGCYRCIFSYGNQHEREKLSRSKAEKEFERIYKSIDFWDYLEEGLGKVTNSGKIEESELEERFINILFRHYNQDGLKEKGYSFQARTEDGVTKYILNIPQVDILLHFEIRPQVSLTSSDGISFSTRPDFMITLLSATKEGEEIKEIIDSVKPIAIYLDGYAYHAAATGNRFETDTIKRLDIIKSNRYQVWVLTWKDLDLFEATEPDSLYKSYHDNKKVLSKTLSGHPVVKSIQPEYLDKKDNLNRLLWWIENNSDKNLQDVFRVFLAVQQASFGTKPLKREDAIDFSGKIETGIDFYPTFKSPDSWLYLDVLPSMDAINTKLLTDLRFKSLLGSVFIKKVGESFDKTSWEYFWQLFNLIQFDIHNIQIYFDSVATNSIIRNDVEGIEDILENFAPEYHNVVNYLLKKHIEFNKDEYFTIQNENGIIEAESFLGIPEHKIVIDPLDEDSGLIFKEKGFKVFKLSDFDLNILLK